MTGIGPLDALSRFDKKMRPMIQSMLSSFPAVSFLLPNSEVYKNDTLVQIASKKYTIEDMDELLR